MAKIDRDYSGIWGLGLGFRVLHFDAFSEPALMLFTERISAFIVGFFWSRRDSEADFDWEDCDSHSGNRMHRLVFTLPCLNSSLVCSFREELERLK